MPDSNFTLTKGQDAVEIDGVGLLDKDNPVSLERAAERMPELQGDDGKPLTGAALERAARSWAETVGLEVSTPGKPTGSQKGGRRAKSKEAPPEEDHSSSRPGANPEILPAGQPEM